MSRIRAAWRRLTGVFAGPRADDDVRAELEAHVEMATAEYVRRGMSRAEARRTALVESRGITQATEAVREQRGLPWLEPIRSFTVAVRGQTDPAALAPAVRRAVEALDPSLPLIGMRPMQRVVAESVDTRRFTMTLLGFFATLSLVLGAIGIYGVLAYAVARRTREFGIRVALGAGRRQVMGLVLAQGLRIVAVGIVTGVAGALAASRVMSGLLFGVSATDPATYAVIAAMVCGIAVVACLVPLGRALRVDPVRALRAE